MKSVLAGIAVAWTLVIAVAGANWVFANYPEVASWIAFAVFVTVAGAVIGWSFTSQPLTSSGTLIK